MTDRLDVDFAVPFRHRLIFTDDLFDVDQAALLELIEPSESQIPRVQFWLDEGVANAVPQLKHKLRTFTERHNDRFKAVGNPQIVDGGEAVKNDTHIVERMLKCMNFADLDRRSYVVVIGGGAVLDAVGFSAAIAHRGIRLIRIPTTTLAQGDSGIGVKNSVNLFNKKNWLGTFAVPWGVINDTALLRSLSDRDFFAGFSEAVKVALLKDTKFFRQIVASASQIRQREMAVAGPIIRQSAEWHLKHITAGGDPFEMLEARPLDFGHWSAHKLETMTGFRIRHGEAVAIGVAIDTVYSSLRYGLASSAAHDVLTCLAEMGFDLFDSAVQDTQGLFAGLEEFRQHLGGRLTLTMLEDIGKPINVHEVDENLMHEAISTVAEFARQIGIQQATSDADAKRDE